MKRFLGIALISVILLFTITGCALPSLGGNSVPSGSPSISSTPVETQSASSSVNATTPAVSSNTQNSLAVSVTGLETLLDSIYNQVNPSVVNIQVLQEVQTPSFYFPGLFPTPDSQQYSSGLGSGFVWDASGNIVTNNHVVAGADSISVTFYDGTVVPATLVGTDPDSDLAVIKINDPAQLLRPVTMADSTQLKVGQLAIAIGNPFGLQSTMTVGFVSGLGRVLPSNESPLGLSYSIPDVIQTDASINPGNSGGVLLDNQGRVIGVTQSIATSSGTSSGVGFAIPSAIVQQVVPSLISVGHYDHPYLGVSVMSLRPELASAMNLPSGQRGALVEDITAGSPAEKAGLQASQNEVTISGQTIAVGGDVIISYNGQTVKSSDDLVTFLARTGSIGEVVTLTVLRGGTEVQVQVTLEKRPSA